MYVMDMDGVDILSKLPDQILQLILSGLPTTEEVIRTSILSKRWRYLWTSIPSIDIDYCDTDYCRGQINYSPLKRKKFKKFVNWVLATKSSSDNLDCFRLRCSSYYDYYYRISMSTVWQWIRVAVMRKVKVVDLVICPSEEEEVHIELPYCLATCASLEVLRLSLCHHSLTLHRSTRLPALRVLELNSLELTDGDLLQHFLESCPALEELSFVHCIFIRLEYLIISYPNNLKKLRIDTRNTDDTTTRPGDGFLYIWIDCPKLVYLEFAGHITDTFLFPTTLNSLNKAVIHPEDLDHHQISYYPREDSIRSLFLQISHAQFLSLSHHFIKELDVQDVSLPNLKTLELITTLDAHIMDVLIKFLICVPHLESLHLIIPEGFSTDKHWNLDEVEARRILAPRLKRVEFLEFKGGKRKLVLARSLLTYGNVLEEMVFNWGNRRRDKSIKAMKNVSKVRKASLNVKLINIFKD